MARGWLVMRNVDFIEACKAIPPHPDPLGGGEGESPRAANSLFAVLRAIPNF